MEKRIIQLETLVTLQEQTVGQLNEEIFRQQQDLMRLRLQVESLEQKINELGGPAPFGGNERPPHY